MACSSPLHSHRKEQGLKTAIKFLPTQWSNTAGSQWLDYKGAAMCHWARTLS